MTAAINAAKNGHRVVLIEKNEKIGKKLYITGKGRCNLTNCSSFDNYMQNIVSNPKFLFSALRGFDCYDTMNMIEEAGIPLKTERGNRVFPLSDKSSDIIKAFDRLLKSNDVDVHLHEKVQNIRLKNGLVDKITTDKAEYDDVDAIIIATGGISYPTTGSTGDGYNFAKVTGHKVIEAVPGLAGIYLDKTANGLDLAFDGKSLMGISLKNVRAEILSNGKVILSEFGEMIFTDKGVSGPIILTLSSKINRLELDKLLLKIDLKPAISEEELDARLLREFKANANKDFKNALSSLLPSGLIPFIISYCGIDGNKKINSVTKAERKSLISALKELKFSIKCLEPIEHAVITAGGVDVGDIEPNTMRSKIVKNMYFAGEVIDIDALTGGYNIQLAISTGYMAGNKIKNNA